MKKAITLTTVALAAWLTLSGTVTAKEPKQKTVTGTGKCAKCALKETDTCQSVIEVKKGSKTTLYYLTDNAVSKDFHKTICKENKNVNATITITDDHGKKTYIATKIELAK